MKNRTRVILDRPGRRIIAEARLPLADAFDIAAGYFGLGYVVTVADDVHAVVVHRPGR